MASNASILSVVNSPTIDFSYNSSTGVLSADFNSDISSISKIYDQVYSRTGTFTWSSAAIGSNPKNAGWQYSWPSTGFLTEKYRSNITPMSADSYNLEWNSAVFLTHNLYYNYDGNTGIIATYNSYDYSIDGGTTWINSLSANSGSVTIFRQIPNFGDPFDNSGASGTGTCLLTAGKGTILKFRPNLQLASNAAPLVSNLTVLGSVTIIIQKI